MSDPSKRKSNIFQESLLIVKGQKKSNKAQTVADRGQDKFPGCISLISIGYETMAVTRARACAKP